MTADARRSSVLIVDDDPDLAALAAVHIRRWGHAVHTVTSADEMRVFLADHPAPDVLLLDVMLGNTDGSRLVGEIKQDLPRLQVIMITRSTSIDAAVRSMRAGAADYITKPLDFDRVRQSITEALEVGRIASHAHRPKEGASRAEERGELFGILGSSPAMQQLFERIENVAPADVSVLILGETGTGKELVARAVHQASRRRDGSFVAVNCAAIPHDLIESALFGHEAGAFTGASEARTGYCEQADGGTLFLDEIAEMTYEVQAKLLRFLQDHRVQRVGSPTSRQVDVRVVAATNVDPALEIERRRLREDLYYRLRVVNLQLPPLRERGGDIELLAEHFLHRAASRHERAFTHFSPEALKQLRDAAWPGNVRELENVIEEAVVLHRGLVLTAEMLPSLPPPPTFATPSATKAPSIANAPPVTGTPSSLSVTWSEWELEEMESLETALQQAGHDPEKAARSLQMSRATIYRRIKKYGLSRRRS